MRETTLLSGDVSLEILDIHVKHMIPAFNTLGTIRSLERKYYSVRAFDRLIELGVSLEKPLPRPRKWRNLERSRERRIKKGTFLVKEVVLTQLSSCQRRRVPAERVI